MEQPSFIYSFRKVRFCDSILLDFRENLPCRAEEESDRPLAVAATLFPAIHTESVRPSFLTNLEKKKSEVFASLFFENCSPSGLAGRLIEGGKITLPSPLRLLRLPLRDATLR